MEHLVSDDVNSRLKFLTCFNLLGSQTAIVSESYYIEKGIDIDSFKKLLIIHDMDEYLNFFLSYNWTKKEIEDFENTFYTVKPYYDRRALLCESLLILLAGNNHSKTIRIQNPIKEIPIKDGIIIDVILQALLDHFQQERYDVTILTKEEAKSEIVHDNFWVDEWKSGIKDSLINQNFSEEPIESIMLFDYAINHQRKREINLEFLNSILENEKHVGARRKNIFLAIEIFQLSYLCRINRFLKQEKISDIEKFKLDNKDCRFIHDCLVVFKRLEDRSKDKTTVTTPEKYIRSVLKQFDLTRWRKDYLFPRININFLFTIKSQISTK